MGVLKAAAQWWKGRSERGPLRKRPQSARRTGSKRSYTLGESGRLTEGWSADPQSMNAELRGRLLRMRGRSRDLCANDDYAKKFLALVKSNVIGAKGVSMKPKSRFPSGEIDVLANRMIAEGWRDWGRVGSCDVTRRLSWRDTERLIMETIARDGEVLVRYIEGEEADNPERFRLQVLEADYLPVTLQDQLRNGNRIEMGVEIDANMRARAYHLHTEHPGDWSYLWQGHRIARVPAEQILHLYLPIRAEQLRGVPWMHTAAIRLNQLGAYEDAEVVASRLAAAKMGFFVPENSEEYEGEGEDDEGFTVTEVEPGLMEQLPPGMKVETWDPRHPSGQFGPFTKSVLRGVASGLNVSYMSLTGDLQGASYSSGRIGLLEERDLWSALQDWIIERAHRAIFRKWLEHALITQTLPLKPERVAKYEQVLWQGRRWDWVDPLKDAKGAETLLKNGLTSRTRIIAQRDGADFAEIAEELKTEEELLKDLRLIGQPKAAVVAGA